MGLRLADIKELLDIRDRGLCPCGPTKDLVERRLSEVDAEIRQLSTVRAQLLVLKKRNEDCVDASADDWSCLVGV
jgi:DNA-binding transcriptional MerR regulator